MSPRNPIDRRMDKFLRNPASIRRAMGAIVTTTAGVVVAAGILMRVIDHREYRSIWVGMWWAIQTVTTVGYGDVTPRARSGRIVASFVMLEGIAFLAIVTAAIASTFIERASRERWAKQEETQEGMDHRFDAIDQRLEELEKLIRAQAARSEDR
jgi:voltage-gated potassium channel Kch